MRHDAAPRRRKGNHATLSRSHSALATDPSHVYLPNHGDHGRSATPTVTEYLASGLTLPAIFSTQFIEARKLTQQGRGGCRARARCTRRAPTHHQASYGADRASIQRVQALREADPDGVAWPESLEAGDRRRSCACEPDDAARLRSPSVSSSSGRAHGASAPASGDTARTSPKDRRPRVRAPPTRPAPESRRWRRHLAASLTITTSECGN